MNARRVWLGFLAIGAGWAINRKLLAATAPSGKAGTGLVLWAMAPSDRSPAGRPGAVR
jgi:hypothetical protein